MYTWPKTMILVHGYANSRLKVGEEALANKGQQDSDWYWKGKYSDNVNEYDVKTMLENAARADGFKEMRVKFANWDGRSTIEEAVRTLTPDKASAIPSSICWTPTPAPTVATWSGTAPVTP